jgi:hypothetical protein
MIQYIGTKIIKAKPTNRADYNSFRGWQLPENENGADDGYLVEYTDGGKPNVEGYLGYVSWSPKEQFERAYRPTDNMNFGLAIEALKNGHKVARRGWNGKNMFLVYVPSTPNCEFKEGSPYMKALNKASAIANINPHIDMYTATGEFQPGWLASQTDMLADDWMIVD